MLRKLRQFVVVLLLMMPLLASAHEYHFAFAEMEYNTTSKAYELTLTVSAKDLEHDLEHEGLNYGHLETIKGNKFIEIELAHFLLEHFSVEDQSSQVEFKFLGFEVLKTGMANFYFESAPEEIPTSLKVKFDLMMDYNQDQQNKLTFIYYQKQYTKAFLYHERLKEIKLD